MSAQPSVAASVLSWLERHHGDALDFWLSGKDAPLASEGWQDHADIIYTLRLLDMHDRISEVAAQRFLEALAHAPLYGRPGHGGDGKTVPNAHLTAYLLGAATLVENATGLTRPDAVYDGWQLSAIIDPATKLPLYPRRWAHHVWRVSHWIGGGPSILWNLARSSKVEGVDLALVDEVLGAVETNLLDRETDLLRPYRSPALQRVFRTLYKTRHDLDLADLGGAVHVLWVYHALGRPYRNGQSLLDASWRQLSARRTFMEAQPYCLDFDIVQLVRTARPAEQAHPKDVQARARAMGTSIAQFLSAIPSGSYSLHKLPGALATMHEAAFITGDEIVPGIGAPRVDIIQEAGWL
ncbi:MAG: hypothetical protein KI785_00990 [Devosiaceae bacterium]|nr:hypothetical protein [Devosiaceae bacterium MH13]